MASPFTPAPFGPFTKGVWEVANPSTELTGALKRAEHWVFSGQDRMSMRPGVVPWMTFMDDAGTPAPITTICAVQAFSDGAIVVGYSSNTNKCYLYRLNDTLTGYYNGTTGALVTGGAIALPLLVVWSSMTAAPDVLCAEGLGFFYIAHTVAADVNGLYWATRYWDGTYPATIHGYLVNSTYTSTGVPVAGTDNAFYLGVISFQQALWGWGYGFGNTVANAYRPELLQYSSPSFGLQFATDNFTIGQRVRSLRERVVGAGVAGQSLFIGGTETMNRITGTGRDSWTNVPIDGSFGFVGPKCMISVGGYLYWWSPRGPMRISGLVLTYGVPPKPEPLYDPVFNLLQTYQNESRIVAFYDPDRDTVGWVYQTTAGVQVLASYDVQRDRFSGTDSDLGVGLYCAGNVKAIYASIATPPAGPAGPPTNPSTTNVGTQGATANWTPGDVLAYTEVSFHPQSDTGGAQWTVLPDMSIGIASCTFNSTSILPGTAYEWRARHFLNGQFSAYLGPGAGTQFTTLTPSGGGGGGGGGPAQLSAPTNCNANRTNTLNAQKQPVPVITVTWTITATGATTIVQASLTSASGPFSAAYTAPIGVASATLQYATGTTPPQYWRCISHQTGFTDSNPSNVDPAF